MAAVFAAAALLTACGNKEYLKDIKAADYVTLGEYTGIEASAKEPVVEDGMVDLYIEMYIKPAYTTTEEVTDRAVETGDTVNIDYTGYIDGEVFDDRFQTFYRRIRGRTDRSRDRRECDTES